MHFNLTEINAYIVKNRTIVNSEGIATTLESINFIMEHSNTLRSAHNKNIHVTQRNAICPLPWKNPRAFFKGLIWKAIIAKKCPWGPQQTIFHIQYMDRGLRRQEETEARTRMMNGAKTARSSTRQLRRLLPSSCWSGFSAETSERTTNLLWRRACYFRNETATREMKVLVLICVVREWYYTLKNSSVDWTADMASITQSTDAVQERRSGGLREDRFFT